MYYTSHEAEKYCSDCSKKYIKTTPFAIENNLTILKDYGLSVLLRYEDIRQEFNKQCYFSTKGRYIKTKEKRYYI